VIVDLALTCSWIECSRLIVTVLPITVAVYVSVVDNADHMRV